MRDKHSSLVFVEGSVKGKSFVTWNAGVIFNCLKTFPVLLLLKRNRLECLALAVTFHLVSYLPEPTGVELLEALTFDKHSNFYCDSDTLVK